MRNFRESCSHMGRMEKRIHEGVGENVRQAFLYCDFSATSQEVVEKGDCLKLLLIGYHFLNG